MNDLQTLFNVYEICEALSTAAHIDPEGEYEGIYTGRCNLEKGSGIILFGRDLVSIDAILPALSDPTRRRIADLNRSSISLAEEEFEAVAGNIIEEARKMVSDWM